MRRNQTERLSGARSYRSRIGYLMSEIRCFTGLNFRVATIHPEKQE
jgi:hypothetical protein